MIVYFVWHNFCGYSYAMKHLFILILAILFVSLLRAQNNCHPQRTAEDIARKQTEMMVRELGIQDSVVRDTLYRMHLKFAQKRAISNTRAEAMLYMQEANEELKQILTHEQYQQFMDQQVNHAPHHPRSPYNRFSKPLIDSLPPPPPGAPNMPPPPPGHLPLGLQ
jgi:hypothetical protein